MKKPRLLMISDSYLVSTGMGRVSKHILELLQSKYDVAIAGWNLITNNDKFNVISANDKYEFTNYCLKKDSKEEKEQVKQAINDFKPDILFCFGDQWNFWYVPEFYKEFPKLVTVCYINVDSGPVSPQHVDKFRYFDKIIVSSNFAREEIKKILPYRDIKVGYHGVDMQDFMPLDKHKCKQSLGISPDTFTLGFIGRNQTRKNIPMLIEIIGKFQKNKHDTKFIISSDLNNRRNVTYDINAILSRYIKKENIRIINKDNKKQIEINQINSLLNAMDIYVSTSYAEGQGMPIQEAMRVGVIPVVPHAYCMKEICPNGVLVPTNNSVILEAEREFSCVDKKMFLNELEGLYHAWKFDHKRFNSLVKKNIEDSFKFKWVNLAKLIDNEIYDAIIEGKDTCITASIFG